MAFDLGELLKDVSGSGTGREQIEYIRLELIEPDPNNFYQLSDLERLADNIATIGLQQPIRLRPIPGETEKYRIVSGHRRRAAIEMLAKEDPERWQEAACIVDEDIASPALQQLRLIYANSGTRTLTSSEISEQAVQVEKLLYQLKEEGFDFPGRMRDHVAKAVGASKSKLARLKVIRDDLSECWRDAWKANDIPESTAYALAQIPAAWQWILHDVHGKHPKGLYESDVKVYAERFRALEKLKCERGYSSHCANAGNMMYASCKDRYTESCRKGCCFDCSSLATCKKSCVHADAKKKEIKTTAKEAERKAAEDQARREAPRLELIRKVYQRVGEARELNRVSVRQLMEAQMRFYVTTDDKRQKELENGTAKITSHTTLPFGISFDVSNALPLIRVADTLDCSIDFLLGRTDDMKPVGTWQTGDPWNFGEYVVLVRYDSAKGPTPEKMSWTEYGWEMLGSLFEDICTDATIVGWMPMPEEGEL